MLRIFAPQAIEDRSKLYVLPGGEYDEESECYGFSSLALLGNMEAARVAYGDYQARCIHSPTFTAAIQDYFNKSNACGVIS